MTDEVKVEQIDITAKASPRPWRIVRYGDGDSLVIHDARGDWRVCFMATPGDSAGALEQIEANAKLIVSAVNARPAPAEDAVEREDEIERLRSALAPFAKAGSIAGERNPYGDFYAYRPAAGDEYAIMGDHLRAALAAMQPRGEQQAGDLAQRCADILDWRATGLLRDGPLKQLAETLPDDDWQYSPQRLAEQQTIRDALQVLSQQAGRGATR